MVKFFIRLILLMGVGLSAYADNRLTDIQLLPLPEDSLRLVLVFKDKLGQEPASFMTKKPARVVFDFSKITSTLPKEKLAKIINIGTLKSYTVLEVKDRLRVILDLSQVGTYSGDVIGKSFSITLSGSAKASIKPDRKINVVNKPLLTKHRIEGINFKGAEKNSGKLIINVSDNELAVNVKEKGNSVEAIFYDSSLSNRLFRHYDVRDFHTPAQSITTRQQGRNVIVSLKNSGDFGHFAYQVDDQFIIDVFGLSAAEAKKAKLKKEIFSGKRISLNFQNIKIRAVLQLLAEFTGINMVVSDSVSGNITLRLNNIPWDQALNIILTTRGLGKRKLGDVLLIAPAEELAKRERAQLLAQQQSKELAPLRSELIQVNYAKAADLAELIKDKNNSLMSKRGTLSVDVRTNTIWLQDTDLHIEEIENLVKKLDVPVKQVLIESRIVIVNKDFEQDIGIRFGVTRPTHLSGTLEGANAMQHVGDAGTLDTPAANVPLADRLNVDLAAAPLLGNPASIGIALAKLGEGILLDLELSALESEGQAEIISSPRLITADQQEATIESGEEIPYQESTSSGATSVAFKKAVLSLNVTPQITPDDRLILKIKVNQDSRGEPTGVFGAPPAIDTKSIETNVLVDNGQTIVLGGIYKQEKNNLVNRVPFLGKLPVVGVLFRQKQNIVKHEELLIFITPKIIRNSLNITDVKGGKVELDKFGKPVRAYQG